jgi:DNA gyrase subunit B
MPELIENGHLYVAQPPLYRVLAGKKELYLKDEDGFNEFLLDRISDREKVVLENGEEISGKRLVNSLNGVIRFYESLDKLARRGYSPRFVEFLASHGPKDRNLFKDEKFMQGLFENLNKSGFQVKDVNQDEESGYYEFLVTETLNGGQTSVVNWEFLSCPELRQLIGIFEDFQGLNKATLTVTGDGESKRIENAQQLLNELMERAKRGLSIQRYKGLGEMNPEQLWSTTMDPEKRNLLKVRIEDWVETDDIFTILMGDKVEARREFIQNNALEVTDLDI